MTLLEKLPVILEKSTEQDVADFVLPLLFQSLESKMSQIQVRNNIIQLIKAKRMNEGLATFFLPLFGGYTKKRIYIYVHEKTFLFHTGDKTFTAIYLQ